jgi:hypothetical protein
MIENTDLFMYLGDLSRRKLGCILDEMNAIPHDTSKRSNV